MTAQRRVLARGSIRVDARRAAAKLREHLLVDLHSYTLELVRAALRLGARELSVRWDADDVVVAFDGQPVSPERLARLLDFALAEAMDDRARALRTLALGVNAALGLGADAVDVVTSSGSSAGRVRFTRALIEQESSFEHVECGLPAGAFETGTWIHVKRGLGLDVMKRALSRQAPREVALLSECTHEAPLRIVVNGAPLVLADHPAALLKVPLRLPGATSARIELTKPGAACSMQLLERGVRLLSGAWVPLAGLEAHARAEVPARLLVDAEELPTNASRSALREDSALAVELPRVTAEGFRAAVSALTHRVLGVGTPSDSVEFLTDDATALEDALGMLVHAVVLSARSQKPIDPQMADLLQLPLLRSAGGDRMPAGPFVTARWAHVWRDEAPLPVELAPWLANVALLSGYAIERVLDGLELVDAKELVERAQSGAVRRQRLLSHPASEPSVPHSSLELLRERFRFETGAEAGLHGELVLLAPTASAAQGSRLRIYVEQRLLEVIPIEPSLCPLAFDAALAWPSTLRPRFDYDAVERDAGLNAAALAVSRVAMRAASRAASRLKQLGGAERAALETLLCSAVAAFSQVPERLGFAPPKHPLRAEFPALWRAAIFPTTEPERRVSLDELDREARRTGALCLGRGARGPAPDGRPVLDTSMEMAKRVAAALHRSITLVPYDRALDSSRQSGSPAGRRTAVLEAIAAERARQQLPPTGPVMWLDLPHSVAAASPGRAGRVAELHLGVTLRARDRDGSNIPIILVFDDARSVPNEEWGDVRWAPPRQVAAHTGQLAEKLVLALEGNQETQIAVGLAPPPGEDTSAYLLEVSSSLQRKERQDAEPAKRGSKKLRALGRRIDALPLIAVLDPDGRPRLASVAEIEAKHGPAPPLLKAPPGFETLEWMPIWVRSASERETLLRRFPAARWADNELARRRADAAAAQRRKQLLALPTRELGDLAPMAAAGELTHQLVPTHDDSPGADLDVVVALPRPGLSASAAWLRVCYERRSVIELTSEEWRLPVVAAVDSRSIEDFDHWRLAPAALARIQGRAKLAAVELASKLLDAARGPGQADRVLGDARVLTLISFLLSSELGAPVLLRLTASDFLWPTIQGGEASLDQLQRSGSKLLFGAEQFQNWQRRDDRASDLDAPILYLAAGPSRSSLQAILEQMGLDLGDATEAAARLQGQRGGAAPMAPILMGRPAHPLLRGKSWELGLTLGDGEIELTEGPASDVTLALLGGTTARVGLALSCPVRAVIRVDALDESSVLDELEPALEAAAAALLARAAGELDQLPAFVRTNARRSICRSVASEGSIAAELAGARVFADTSAARWSLGELVTRGSWRFTTLEPPFPELSDPLLVLTQEEAGQLGKLVTVTLSNGVVEREREAALRRSAPPRSSIELEREQRNACVVTSKFDTGVAQGEVGVLAPSELERRGIWLFSSRRSLCRVDDGAGWPVVAAVADDTIVPNHWFDAVSNPSAVATTRRLVRETATAALRRMFSPPPTALASHWLDDVAHGGFRVTGCLWLDSTFPPIPGVSVLSSVQPLPIARPLQLDASSFVGSKALPIEGNLLVKHDDEQIDASTSSNLDLLAKLWPALTELAAGVATRLLATAREHGPSPAAEEHAWSLALLGLDVSPAPAHALSGELLAPARISEELSARGAIWLSDGRGWVEGEFPGATPSFVLPDDGSALLRVLSLRAPAGALRRLGAALPDVHLLATPRLTPENPRPMPELSAPNIQAFAPRSRWTRLASTLSRWFGDQPEQIEAGTLDELAPLLQTLRELALAGDPVARIVAAPTGRAFELKQRARHLRVDPSELGPLLARSTVDQEALRALAAAAVSEINRALSEVTDAEERRALIALLNEL